MIVFYLFIVILVFYKVSFSKELDFSALNKDRTDSIKGIFILFVFLRHIFPYIEKYCTNFNRFDRLFEVSDKYLGQLIVVMFMFYSGYGVMESCKKKSTAYVETMPPKRILSTILNFMVAVGFFLLIQMLMGQHYPLSKVALAFVGWESIGNSNWYIFTIVACYIVTYFSFSKCGVTDSERLKTSLYVTFVGLLLFIVTMCFFKETYWFNTVFAYLAGLVFSFKKDFAFDRIRMGYKKLLLLSTVTFLTLSVLYLFVREFDRIGLVFNFCSIAFAFVILLLTLRVKISNNVLVWLGSNLFPLYIYQRIPMLVLASLFGTTLISTFPYLYVVICFIFTILLANLYKYIAIKL